MAKLYFRYGAMNSAKTLNLLAVAHNYRSQGKEVLIIKPSTDTRFGSKSVKSRAGLSAEADVILNKGECIPESKLRGIYCILVDEAQFLSPQTIENFREISLNYSIPVICYGLRTDFRTELFPGSKRLMELSDNIEEIKTVCHNCTKKAIVNMRTVDGKPVSKGAQVVLGGEDNYQPVCYGCFVDAFGGKPPFSI
jgi:thymidine kinase